MVTSYILINMIIIFMAAHHSITYVMIFSN